MKLVEHHSDTIYKDAAARRHFNEGTFHGYDFDNTMLRIGSMIAKSSSRPPERVS